MHHSSIQFRMAIADDMILWSMVNPQHFNMAHKVGYVFQWPFWFIAIKLSIVHAVHCSRKEKKYWFEHVKQA